MKIQAIKLPADSKIRGVASDIKGDKILIYSDNEGELFYKDIACKRAEVVTYLGYKSEANSVVYFVAGVDNVSDRRDQIYKHLDECKKFGVEAPILAIVGIRDSLVKDIEDLL